MQCTRPIALIRHGETEWNRSGILQGWRDSRLTPKGIQQIRHSARKIVKYQSNNPFPIYTSDLGRSLSSARILANELGGYLVVDKRLREREFGELEGKPLGADFVRKNKKMPETIERYHSRIQAFITTVTRQQSDQPVIVVGHGEWIRTWQQMYNGGAEVPLPKNGDIIVGKLESGKKAS
ncbi:histidine phosphatase family protein [Vibrio sp. S9_S30]|uniref:histidine phosphatase family protein n=1 Tax=Vibrio sp. S9_S30 TaxID=2720226 RepID=UPI00168059AB|nr:histidine phosphatase family protein [Vibrio sp. S9_S30]MBD1556158.1 histidine phosphatase family protein [Vibrio sp. S9_S30]